MIDEKKLELFHKRYLPIVLSQCFRNFILTLQKSIDTIEKKFLWNNKYFSFANRVPTADKFIE